MKYIYIILFFISNICYGQQFITVSIQKKVTVNNTVLPPGCDSDAQTFIDNAGITDSDQQDWICTLVQQLKDSSLWDKAILLYPIIGGTADKHKYNLKDPQNTDAAGRLIYTGSFTHTDTGMFTTTNARANTYLAYNTTDNDSMSMAVYVTTNTAYGFGSFGVAGGFSEIYSPFLSNNNIYLYQQGANNVTTNASIGVSDVRGMYIVNSIASGTQTIFNGVQKSSQATRATQTSSTLTYKINHNQGWQGSYSFVWFGEGLTTDEIRKLNNIAEAYLDSRGMGVQ